MARPDIVKLHDCRDHGVDSQSELFLVEGDSASRTVIRVRDARIQAVLPMQGKPLNARRASKQSVAGHAFYQRLIAALGAGWDDTFRWTQLRYNRVLILMDPDADGIHCGVLLLMFFHRWMPALLEEGRIHQIHPPLYRLESRAGETRYAYSDDHFHRLRAYLTTRAIAFTSRRYRGLASIQAADLTETCIQPGTRTASILSRTDAEAAIEVFDCQRGRPT